MVKKVVSNSEDRRKLPLLGRDTESDVNVFGTCLRMSVECSLYCILLYETVYG